MLGNGGNLELSVSKVTRVRLVAHICTLTLVVKAGLPPGVQGLSGLQSDSCISNKTKQGLGGQRACLAILSTCAWFPEPMWRVPMQSWVADGPLPAERGPVLGFHSQVPCMKAGHLRDPRWWEAAYRRLLTQCQGPFYSKQRRQHPKNTWSCPGASTHMHTCAHMNTFGNHLTGWWQLKEAYTIVSSSFSMIRLFTSKFTDNKSLYWHIKINDFLNSTSELHNSYRV